MGRFIMLGIAAVLAAGCSQLTGQQQGAQYAGGYESGMFSGTWVAQGGSLQLQEQGGQIVGQGSGQGWSAQISGTSSGNQMTGMFRMQDGSQGQFQAYTDGNQLTIVVPNRGNLVFTRAGGAAPQQYGMPAQGMPAQGVPAQGMPAPGAPAQPVKKVEGNVPAPGKQAASGPPAHDDMEGWEVRTPDNWKFEVKGNAAMFGSNTETGVIWVSYARGLSHEQAEQGAAGYFSQLGATMHGDPKPFTARGGKGLAMEMEGNVQGTQVEARLLTVAGPNGLLIITGIAAPDKLPALRKRVDQIAQSARFFTPKKSPGQDALVGTWWHYHGTDIGTSSSSYERTIELCADGSYYDSDESNISITAKTKMEGSDAWGNPISGVESTNNGYRQGQGNGQWVAQGDDLSGRIRLTANNGQVEEHQYTFRKRAGGDIDLDNRWYGRAPEKGGRCR